MQRTKSSNASIDNLAKNLINKCNNIQRLDSINNKIMSSMNEQEYEANYNGNANNGINILNTNGQNGNKSNLGSPSSPSSLSSSSSTSSTSSISSNQATAAAVQAAVQALLQQNNTSNQSLLTSTAAVNNAKSLLTPKELAKLNLDVKNFNLKDSSLLMQQQQQQLNNLLGATASPNSQSNLLNLQQQLLMQSQNLDQNAMMNLLNNQLNEKNRQKGQTKPRGNTPKQRRSKMEQNFEDSIEALMATAAVNATSGLNINLINKHNQRNNTMRRNEIKGNSMSPSPPGTTCSDETETQNSGSPLSKNELYCASISSASGSSVDENHRRRLNKNRKNAEDIMENDCDEHDDLASSPRSLTQNDNDIMSSQTHNDYDSSILNENGDDNHMNSHYDDMDNDDYDDDDHLDDDDENSYDNNSSINKKVNKKDARRNRNNSTSSPTRSSSSTPQSRSISPSNSYHDSPAAFPNLAAVAAANGIDSTTAMLAAQSLLQQQTPGLTFPNLTAGSANTSGSQSNQGSSRKRRNDRESMSERNKKIKPVPDDKKDDAYWERRRKNNEAAKRSRDLRRQKEDEIAVRASFLESENLKLKAQVTILKAELSKLHFMLYNR